MTDAAEIVEGHVAVLDDVAQRLEGATIIANLLKRRHGLKKGLTAAAARDLIWIYNDPACTTG